MSLDAQNIRLECLKFAGGDIGRASDALDFVIGSTEQERLLCIGHRLHEMLQGCSDYTDVRAMALTIECYFREALVAAGLDRSVMERELPWWAYSDFPLTPPEETRCFKVHADGSHPVESRDCAHGAQILAEVRKHQVYFGA